MNSFEDIKKRSASKSELVVNYRDAMELLYIFEGEGTQILGWEGWIKFSDGRLGHSPKYQGIADLATLDLKAAIALVKSTIMQSYNEWNEIEETSDGELLFCISTNT